MSTTANGTSADLQTTPDSRARARGHVTERLLLIAEDMAGGLWSDARRKMRAEQWGVSESTVMNYAAEASRLVKLLKREHARLRIARALDAGMTVAESALEEGGIGLLCQECNAPCGHRDTSVLGQLPALADRYAKLTGADEPTKAQHDVVVRAAPPGVEQSQWEALQQGDPVALAEVNVVGCREAIPTFAELEPGKRAAAIAEMRALLDDVERGGS